MVPLGSAPRLPILPQKWVTRGTCSPLSIRTASPYPFPLTSTPFPRVRCLGPTRRWPLVAYIGRRSHPQAAQPQPPSRRHRGDIVRQSGWERKRKAGREAGREAGSQAEIDLPEMCQLRGMLPANWLNVSDTSPTLHAHTHTLSTPSSCSPNPAHSLSSSLSFSLAAVFWRASMGRMCNL